MSVNIAVIDRPPESIVDQVTQRLLAFNRERAPALEAERVFAAAWEARDVVGGAIAYVYGGWAELYVLWVDPEVRGAGIGSRLVAAIEERAIAMGCVGLHTDTFAFQALPFYEGLGYEVFGVLEGFSDGNTRYYLKKRFVTP